VAERILDPATGQRIAEVPEASVAQVNAAVAAAEKGGCGVGADGARGTRATRCCCASPIASTADGAAFAKLESDNTGKPLAASAQ